MGLQHTAFKERVRQPGLLSPPRRRPQDALRPQTPVQLSEGGHSDEQGRGFSEMLSKRTRVTIKGHGKRKKKEISQWVGIGTGCHRDCGSPSLGIFKLDGRRPRATWSNVRGSPASSWVLDQMASRGPSQSKFFHDCMMLQFTCGMPMLSNALRTYRQTH